MVTRAGKFALPADMATGVTTSLVNMALAQQGAQFLHLRLLSALLVLPDEPVSGDDMPDWPAWPSVSCVSDVTAW